MSGGNEAWGGYELRVEPDPPIEDVQTLSRELGAYNERHAGRENSRRITAFLRDHDRKVLGGFYGYTHWGWLFVSHLWVCAALRNKGYGRALMRAAEQEARAHGCTHAYVDTFDFQARGFYEKLGYEVFGKLDDFPEGHVRYYLKKRLPASGL